MLTIGVCDDEPVMLESFLERIRLFFSGEGLEIRTVPLFQRTGAAGLPGRAGCALPVLAAGCGLGVLPAPLPARVGALWALLCLWGILAMGMAVRDALLGALLTAAVSQLALTPSPFCWRRLCLPGFRRKWDGYSPWPGRRWPRPFYAVSPSAPSPAGRISSCPLWRLLPPRGCA